MNFDLPEPRTFPGLTAFGEARVRRQDLVRSSHGVRPVDQLCAHLAEQIVTLRAPVRRDVLDFGCSSKPQTVRLVRHVAPNGEARVLMTNLLDTTRFPANRFTGLYHQRWRIEEAFKRLKHRLNLEHASGLSQLAVKQDVAAKELCDNLQALATLEARSSDELPDRERINRAYAHTALKPLLPALS